MTLGERIHQKRCENNITLDELGKSIGVEKGTVHKYETGLITNIPIDRLEKIAAALNTTPSYLLGYSTVPTESTHLSDLTPEEQNIVQAFRGASPEVQAILRRIIDAE